MILWFKINDYGIVTLRSVIDIKAFLQSQSY